MGLRNGDEANRFPEDSAPQKDIPYGKPNGIPTVIRWNGGPAASVKIMGQFNEWQKHGLPLNKSGDDFCSEPTWGSRTMWSRVISCNS